MSLSKIIEFLHYSCSRIRSYLSGKKKRPKPLELEKKNLKLNNSIAPGLFPDMPRRKTRETFVDSETDSEEDYEYDYGYEHGYQASNNSHSSQDTSILDNFQDLQSYSAKSFMKSPDYIPAPKDDKTSIPGSEDSIFPRIDYSQFDPSSTNYISIFPC